MVLWLCRYCAGEDVLEQAFRLNFAPCIVIRGHLLTMLGLSKQVKHCSDMCWRESCHYMLTRKQRGPHAAKCKVE